MTLKFSQFQWVVRAAHSGGMMALMAPPDFRDKLRKLGLLEAPGVEPESLHVTLLYLGNADELNKSTRQRIVTALHDIAKNHPPIELKLGGFGRFLPGKNGTPLYGTCTGPGLSKLQADLEKAVGQIITLPNQHGWVPHLTLGYLKPGSDYQLPEIEPDEAPSWKATEVSLVLADESFDTAVLSGVPSVTEKPTQRAASVEHSALPVNQSIPIYRAGLIVVFNANPKWHKKPEKGWWFTAQPGLPSEVVEVFKDLSGNNKTGIHRFYKWSEQGYNGWWTKSKSLAATAHKAIEMLGYDLEYMSGLPFDRELAPYEPPDPIRTKWNGDLSVVVKGLMLLLDFPDLQDKDAKRIRRYIKHVRDRQWLTVAEVENIKKIMKRRHNLKWLKFKNYTRRKTIYDAEFNPTHDISLSFELEVQ